MVLKKDTRGLFDIVVRYFIILLLGLGNLYLFYLVLKPLTLFGVGLILRIFSDVVVVSDGFIVSGVFFNLVSACVGGSAFYLLFILIMSCRDIEVFKRVRIILFAFLVLYVFNVLRIVFMVSIYGVFYFDLIHWVIWYFVSTLFVVVIWFLIVRLYGIRSIPVYSDFMFIVGAFNKVKGKRNKRKGKVKRKGKR